MCEATVSPNFCLAGYIVHFVCVDNDLVIRMTISLMMQLFLPALFIMAGLHDVLNEQFGVMAAWAVTLVTKSNS